MNPGRPERAETNEYYFRYIDLVPDGDIREILEEQRGATLAFLETVPESRGSHRYADGKWSVTEVLNHINDCERLFMLRAFWFARALTPPLPSFEPDDALKAAKAEEKPWSAHVEEFAAIRASTVAFFRNLPDEAWLHSGVASDYPFSVRALAYIAAGHVIHHVGILKERYL